MKVTNGALYKAVATCDKDSSAPPAGAVSNHYHSSSVCRLNNAVRASPMITQKSSTLDEPAAWTRDDFDGKLPSHRIHSFIHLL